ncbi:hypothetical protein HRUBRA_02304 [Pseudohaliea rubra DSM 19751]|uniref:Glycosyltransferase RgtA/B/C/D-like domain-containing protein n=1 Tax=Pseudohaliea rubra DSM 19751 TaxID=1265313 RepID=A0A095VNR1_9GAMM|nr:hypothetical protein HRUBRA_02304 [Pseudohaliea rubra DSM 19751]
MVTRALWLVAGVLLYLSFGYTEMMGSDLWWHLAAGREMLAQGTVWLDDPFSYSAAGEPWRNHEWLADLIFYGWANVFGVPALVYWKWLVVVATYLGLALVLERMGGDRGAAVLAAAVALALAAPFIDVRPHLYTLAGVVLLLHLALERPPRRLPLCLLFLLWANLHGGFVFGLMALALLVFPWRSPSPGALRARGVTILACALTSLLNPDGIVVFVQPIEYAFTDSPYRSLGEWLSPFLPGGIRAPLFVPALGVAAAAIVAHGVVACLGRGRLPWSALALCALTVAMAVTSRRFIPLFGLSLALLLAPLLAALFRVAPLRRLSPFLAGATLVLALLRLAPLPLAAGPAYHYLTAEYAYPEHLVDVITGNHLAGDTFAYYNWGGYLHWRTGGALRVFIDGRANTVYDDDTYLAYLRVARARPGWISVVEDSGADFFLWPLESAGGPRLLAELAATGRWQLVYAGFRGALMARRGAALPEAITLTQGYPLELSRAREALRRGAWDTAEGAARRALDAVPWHQGACSTLASALRGQDRAADAALVIAGCRRYFPTRYLR